MTTKVSVGITAFNEEKAIPFLLRSIMAQNLPSKFELVEILIVSSGSTDRTNEIVKEFNMQDPRIILIEEPVKRGKPAATNTIIKSFKGEILVLSGADGIYKNNALYWLLSAFNDDRTAAVCGHPVPLNSKNHMWGYGAYLLWETHHLICLNYPQRLSGELLAIQKKYVFPVPEHAGGDDVYLEQKVVKMHGGINYAPRAVIYILGPQTVGDYFKQRRRVMSHVYFAEKMTSVKSTTTNNLSVFSVIMRYFNRLKSKYMIPVMVMELLARVFALLDVRTGHITSNWARIESTKFENTDSPELHEIQP